MQDMIGSLVQSMLYVPLSELAGRRDAYIIDHFVNKVYP